MSPESAWEQELRERLREIFVAEAAERLAALDAAAALLRSDGDLGGGDRAHQLGEAFRQSHTLKGAARAAGLPDVERAARGLEDAFERLKSGEAASPETWNAIRAGIDELSALIPGASG